MGKPSLSAVQSVVGLVAGLTSIAGAAYSAIGYLHAPPPPGEVVTIVREAGSERAVAGAVIEIETAASTPVATMRDGDDGVARRAIAPGDYRIRVVHPAFADAVQSVRVEPGARSEVAVALEPRTSTGVRTASTRGARSATGPATVAGRALDHGVTVTRHLLGRLGL